MQGLLYTNAAIVAREADMLGKDRLARLVDCSTLAEAVKVLTECGYAGGMIINRSEDYGQLVQKDKELARSFVKSLMPKNSGLECFFMDRDYLNLKIFAKKKLWGANIEFAEGGMVDTSLIAEAYEDGSTDTLSDSMAKVVKTILKMEKPTPQSIDILCDRAYFAEVLRVAKKSRQELIISHFSLLLDARNLLTVLRAKKASLDFKAVSEQFLENGSFSIEDVKKIWDEDIEQIVLKLSKNLAFAKVFAEAGADTVAIEKGIDEFLMKKIYDNRNDMFSVAPTLFYLWGKELETLAVNVILTGIKNNVDKEVVKARLRQIYARN